MGSEWVKKRMSEHENIKKPMKEKFLITQIASKRDRNFTQSKVSSSEREREIALHIMGFDGQILFSSIFDPISSDTQNKMKWMKRKIYSQSSILRSGEKPEHQCQWF